MLAGKIAYLACLWLGVVAGRFLAANIWVDVGTSRGAVAVCRDGHGVDVVDYLPISSSFPLSPAVTTYDKGHLRPRTGNPTS